MPGFQGAKKLALELQFCRLGHVISMVVLYGSNKPCQVLAENRSNSAAAKMASRCRPPFAQAFQGDSGNHGYL